MLAPTSHTFWGQKNKVRLPKTEPWLNKFLASRDLSRDCRAFVVLEMRWNYSVHSMLLGPVRELRCSEACLRCMTGSWSNLWFSRRRVQMNDRIQQQKNGNAATRGITGLLLPQQLTTRTPQRQGEPDCRCHNTWQNDVATSLKQRSEVPEHVQPSRCREPGIHQEVLNSQLVHRPLLI